MVRIDSKVFIFSAIFSLSCISGFVKTATSAKALVDHNDSGLESSSWFVPERYSGRFLNEETEGLDPKKHWTCSKEFYEGRLVTVFRPPYAKPRDDSDEIIAILDSVRSFLNERSRRRDS